MRGGMMMGGLQLLTITEVQTELKMTQPQIDKLEPKQQEVRTAMRDLMQNAGNMQQMSAADREKLMAKMQELQKKAVTDILDTVQYKRFHQIELQQAGSRAFMRPDVIAALGITEEQKTKLQQIQQTAMQQMRNNQQNADPRNMTDEQRAEMQKTMTEARKKQMADCVAVLTDAQKKAWKTMLGTEFKMPTQRMRPNRNQQPPQP